MQWRYEARSLRRLYEPLIAQAKGDERQNLHQEYGSELWKIDCDRRDDSDSKLIRKARRYDIPIPSKQEKDGLWEEFESGFWLLTDKGVHHILKEIRAEQKERLALRQGMA